MYQYLEASKPFIVSTSVGIIIVILFSMDRPEFGNPIRTEVEKAILLK